MTKPAFAVRLDAALRVRPFISKDDVRWYLRGISIEPGADGGAVCAATDGHRLGIRHDRKGRVYEASIVTLPPEIKMPGKLLTPPWLVGMLTAPGKGHISIVSAAPKKDEDTAEFAIERVEDCTLRIGHAFIDHTFPDWRRIVPKPTDKDVVRSFNGEYVKGFGKYLTLRAPDAAAPHLIEIAGEPEFLGVLMPMRVESKGKLPDWIAAPKEPAKKKAA